jgi:2-isopropylmalate synthase
MLDDSFHVYDTTLRDGAQQEGLNLTVADKLVIARQLDELGVGFIEGGWPGAIPKDTEFFRRARTELDLKHAQLAAFGATRRPGVKAADDPQVAALRESGAPVVTLVAKSHDRHVLLALRTTLEENLEMINPDYALEVLKTAAAAGADVIALCDTNGGMLPAELADTVTTVKQATQARLGIHCHDDTACGVANTLVAVDAGVTHVQGTANGYGERAGNANLFSVVAGLQLKQGRSVVPDASIKEMARIAHAISEVTNVAPDTHQPYVGLSAFAHKAGLHASAIKVDPMLYQHIDPALVGNDMRMLVSDMAGRASVELKGRELGYDLSGDKEVIAKVTDRVKDLEANGYTFEAADASFELLLRDELGQRREYFAVESWRVIVERHPDQRMTSEATVRLEAKGERLVAVGEGNGPVNALDKALRAALEQLYPELANLELTDYKVRILAGSHGTGAVTRVLIESDDGTGDTWSTVGVDENIIAASWHALEEAVTYCLLRSGREPS